jgi:hypothetical protein
VEVNSEPARTAEPAAILPLAYWAKLQAAPYLGAMTLNMLFELIESEADGAFLLSLEVFSIGALTVA